MGVIELASATTVQGKVTVNGKSPGAKVGLKVTLANDPGFTLSPEPQTETDGTFSIKDVPANMGSITVTATYQGQSKASGPTPPKPSDVTDVGTIDFSCPATAWGSNSPTIVPGKSLTISVTGGQAPYLWTAEIEGANGGKGFTLAGTTNAPTNILVAAANACGSVKITVRGCNGIGEPTTGYVRAEPPAGVWVRIGICAQCSVPAPAPVYYRYDSSGRQYRIHGGRSQGACTWPKYCSLPQNACCGFAGGIAADECSCPGADPNLTATALEIEQFEWKCSP
jgi:hypothetical protein